MANMTVICKLNAQNYQQFQILTTIILSIIIHFKYTTTFIISISIPQIHATIHIKFYYQQLLVEQNSMKVSRFSHLILILFFIHIANSATCDDFLLQLVDLTVTNRSQALMILAPYLLNSGKYLEDLGFPQTCMRTKNSNFSTVQFIVPQNHFNYTAYYGFCFSNLCSAEELNSYKKSVLFIIENYTTINLPQNVDFNVVYSPLEPRITFSAVLLYIILSLLVIFGMIYSLRIWINQCRNVQQKRQRFTFQDGQMYQQQQMTFLRKMSLQYKCTQYLFGKRQKSNKIISFSIFKLICVPFTVLGLQFYLRNYAAFNYFAFNGELYQTFYSKLATFSLYLPDTLFFISAFLLSNKCLRSEQYSVKQSFTFFKRKFVRLYPVYLTILLFYWLISPTLHGGPVWYVYQNDVAHCNKRWWRSILLFDNLFSKKNCFSNGWFVQTQIQCAILCLFFFLIYRKFKKISIFIYISTLIGLTVVTTVFSPKMPVTLENTLSHHFYDYFKSTYSHLLFYFFGIGVAIIKSNVQINQKIQQIFQKKPVVEIVLTVLSIGILILILLRPSIWATASGVQLTLSRLGAFLCFLILFLGGIFRSEDNENNTYVHKFAHYSYGVMLFSSIVASCSVWGLSSLFYISGGSILNLLVTQTIISLICGTFIGIVVQYRLGKK